MVREPATRSGAVCVSRMLAARPQHRVTCSRPLEYSLVDGDPRSGRLVSVGINGLRLDLPDDLEPGAEVTVLLPTGKEGVDGPEILELPCRVMWALLECPEPPYPTGLAFAPLEDGLRRAYDSFLDTFESEP